MTARAWLLEAAPASRRQARLGRFYRAWLAFRRNRLAVVGLVLVAALVLTALAAPLLVAHDRALHQILAERLRAASGAHPFGTDELGRDILARIVWGSRITLFIVVMVAALVVPVGLGIGIPAGYLGGVADIVLMRLTDVFLAFPRLILALAFAAAMGPGVRSAIIAIALTSWPPYARLARAEALMRRDAEFVLAARLQGASALRVVWRQIMPLCLPSVVVRLTLDMGGVIVTAAGLGFLGLGAQPPEPEWGAMISSGAKVILDQWWVATVPGAAIFLASLGFNLLGDGLREVSDSRLA